MKHKSRLNQENGDLYILHTKVSLDKLSEQLSNNQLPEKYRGLIGGALTVFHYCLSAEVLNVYQEDLGIKGEFIQGNYLLEPEDGRCKTLINCHESGPEVWILPVASFIAGGISSGVLGNLAYDLLKDLYKKTITAFRNLTMPHEKSKKHEMFELRLYKPNDMSDHDFEDARKMIEGLIEIRVITPKGEFAVSFDKQEGLPPEISRYLTDQIKSYKKRSPKSR